MNFRSPHSRVNSITPAFNNFAYSYCGGLYNLNIRELQTTEIDLRRIQGERGRIWTPAKFTYDNAMAREAQTGSSRMCLMGYKAPAAIGTAAVLYISAHSYRATKLVASPYTA
jgi:hypothetical protein